MASFASTPEQLRILNFLESSDLETAPEHDWQVGDVFHTLAGVTEFVVVNIDSKGIHSAFVDNGQPSVTWWNTRSLVFVR